VIGLAETVHRGRHELLVHLGRVVERRRSRERERVSGSPDGVVADFPGTEDHEDEDVRQHEFHHQRLKVRRACASA
jgi:hypothetical protein